LFLGIRAALIVMMTIPLIFAVVMGSDWLAGPTINRITLYALILALGMLGEFFYPIAFNLPVAMITSLLVAYMIIPWAAQRFLPVPTKEHKEDLLQTGYRKLFTFLCHSKLLRFSFFSFILILLGYLPGNLFVLKGSQGMFQTMQFL